MLRSAKTLVILMGLGLSFSFAALAQAIGSSSEVVKVERADSENRNLIIRRNEDKSLWLLHHKAGCQGISAGQWVSLGILGSLDGEGETLRGNGQQNCKVDQALEFNEYLRVRKIENSRVSGYVKSNGKSYYIYVRAECTQLKNQEGREIYLQQFGNVLNQGDLLHFPGKGISCPITYAEEQKGNETPLSREPLESNQKVRLPGPVSQLKASPSQNSAYLRWKISTKGAQPIDHYLIGYSPHALQSPNEGLEAMPFLLETQNSKPNYTVTGLESDQIYYFYVKAVDEVGNQSEDWSNVASASLKSSISTTTQLENSGPLNLKEVSQTGEAFFFEWSSLKELRAQTIELQVDGKSVFIHHQWPKNNFKVLKLPSRKGKVMVLNVWNYDLHGQMKKETLHFSF